MLVSERHTGHSQHAGNASDSQDITTAAAPTVQENERDDLVKELERPTQRESVRQGLTAAELCVPPWHRCNGHNSVSPLVVAERNVEEFLCSGVLWNVSATTRAAAASAALWWHWELHQLLSIISHLMSHCMQSFNMGLITAVILSRSLLSGPVLKMC